MPADKSIILGLKWRKFYELDLFAGGQTFVS